MKDFCIKLSNMASDASNTSVVWESNGDSQFNVAVNIQEVATKLGVSERDVGIYFDEHNFMELSKRDGRTIFFHSLFQPTSPPQHVMTSTDVEKLALEAIMHVLGRSK